MSAAVVKLKTNDLAVAYVRAGWALCAIPRGGKKPVTEKWNTRENAIVTKERAGNLYEGVGLQHLHSGTCCLDFDDLKAATAWLAERGVDAGELIDDPDAVKILSGRRNRTKLLYTVPADVDALTLVSIKRGGEKNQALEFRCAAATGNSVQDALPPTVHPDTGKPYYWAYGETRELLGDWHNPPELPPAVLALWRKELEPKDKHREPSEASGDPHALQESDVREMFAHIQPDDGDRGVWLTQMFATRRAFLAATVFSDEDVWLDILHEHSEPGWNLEGTSKYDSCGDELRAKWTEADDQDGPGIGYLWNRALEGGFEPTAEQTARLHNDSVKDKFDDVSGESLVGEPDATRFKYLSRVEAKALPQPTYLIDELLPQADVGVIYGQPGGGKTFIAIDLAYAVARGIEWRGKAVKQGGVLYIAAEDEAGVRLRMDAYEQEHGLKAADVPVLTLCDAPNVMDKQTRRDHLAASKKAAAEVNARLIIVDTLASVTAGADENSAKDMTVLIDYCKRLHRETCALVLLVHHEGKTQGKGPRGSSALHGAFGVELFVEGESDAPSTAVRTTKVTKLKNGPAGAVFAFKLAVVTLGAFDDEPRTSCVVEHVAEVPTRKKKGPGGKHQKTLLEAAGDVMSPDDRTGDVEALIAEAVDRTPQDPEKRDMRSRRLREALQTMSEHIEIFKDGTRFRVVD